MDVMLYEATQNWVPPRITIVIIVFSLFNTGYSVRAIYILKEYWNFKKLNNSQFYVLTVQTTSYV